MLNEVVNDRSVTGTISTQAVPALSPAPDATSWRDLVYKENTLYYSLLSGVIQVKISATMAEVCGIMY
jgi:hypothetical protein